jgi:hypothetical protein
MAQIQFAKPEKTSTLLPEGIYDFEITQVTQTTAKSSGNPQLEIKLSVIGPEAYAGKTIMQWWSLTAKSTWKLFKLLDATGVDYDEADGQINFDTDMLEGSIFRAKVTQEENPSNGNLNNRLGNEQPSPLSTEEHAAPAPASGAAPAGLGRAGDATASVGAIASAVAAPATAPAGGGFQPRTGSRR